MGHVQTYQCILYSGKEGSYDNPAYIGNDSDMYRRESLTKVEMDKPVVEKEPLTYQVSQMYESFKVYFLFNHCLVKIEITMVSHISDTISDTIYTDGKCCHGK